MLRAGSSLTILCNSPISIRNPNYGHSHDSGSPFSIKDCVSKYIRVPCGHCAECVKKKQMFLVQRVQMECLSNYLYFATFTYSDKYLPIYTTSTGRKIRYADWNDLQLCLKRIRNNNGFSRPFKYMAVSERGSKRGRPHFHALFLLPKYKTDDRYTPQNLEKIMFDNFLKYWARNVGTRKNPEYRQLLDYKKMIFHGAVKTNYDLHYIQPTVYDDGLTSVAFYVTKYLLKESDVDTKLQMALKLNYDMEEFEVIWKTVKSRTICSKFFGLNKDEKGNIDSKIYDYIRDCINKSDDLPMFFNTQNGKSFPLSRYYKSKGMLYNLDDAIRFTKFDESGNPIFIYDDKHYSQLIQSLKDYEKIQSNVETSGDMDNYGNCFG